MTVRINLARSAKEETAFSRQFNMDLHTTQRKGTGYDFTCKHTGRKYELKADYAAARTGNHFLEREQSNDGGATWVPSGFSLSLEQAYAYVVKIDLHYFFVRCTDLAEMLRTTFFQPIRTRPGVNGNRAGVLARGSLIPLSKLREVTYEVTPQEEV